MPRQRLVLLYGGRSGEHEISLISAASVLANLDRTRYQVIPVAMDKEGRCFVHTLESIADQTQALPVMTNTARMLPSLLINGTFALEADIVFPVVHGPMYEDGCLQGLLNLANIAYVGCDVLSSAIGMDKDIARRLCSLHNIATAKYRSISSYINELTLHAFAVDTVAALGWPLFVKPCSMGSSVGIHKVYDLVELLDAIQDARRYDETVIIESYVKGREIEVAVLENANFGHDPLVSVPGEICVHHPNGFYSYTAKYLESDATTLHIPASLTSALSARIQQIAKDIFVALKCKGMARVDFFVNDETEEIYFNEINTLPGFTTISMYPKLWAASGVPYSELLDRLINLAIMHHQHKQQRVTHYK